MADDLWSSPLKEQSTSQKRKTGDAGPEAGKSNLRDDRDSRQEKQESKDDALRKELVSVRKVNEAIEGVIQSLDKAKTSMSSVNQTVNSASSLLNMWTRILSQTEHNQRLILNPAWQGTSQEVSDLEQEVYAKQQAAERRELEEQEKRAAAAKKADDEERRKADVTVKTTKPSQRGKGRPVSGSTGSAQTSTPGYVAVGGQGATRGGARGSTGGSRRATPGAGRGSGSRGRGAGG